MRRFSLSTVLGLLLIALLLTGCGPGASPNNPALPDNAANGNVSWLKTGETTAASDADTSTYQPPITENYVVSNRPAPGLPSGTQLAFNTIEIDRISVFSPVSDITLCVEQNQPDYMNSNNIYNNLSPGARAKINELDFSKYFLIAVFQGNRSYNESGISIENILLNGANIYAVADINENNTVVHPLSTRTYHVIAVEKAQLPGPGSYYCKLIDKTGFIRSGGGLYIPDPNPPPPVTTGYGPTNCIPPPDPVSAALSISSGTGVNTPAELTFTVHNESGVTETQAWLEFYWTNTEGSYLEAKSQIQIPPEQLLGNGKSSWQISSPGETDINITSKISLPKAGAWLIKAFFYDASKQLYKNELTVIVDAGRLPEGEDGFNSNTTDAPIEGILLELDISKAPRPGEKILLTYRLVSLKTDVPEFYTFVRLWNRVISTTERYYVFTHVFSAEDKWILNGSLKYLGSLKKGNPIVLTATVKIPEEGEWQFHAAGDFHPISSPMSDLNRAITLSITGDSSLFGYPPMYEYGGARIDGTSMGGVMEWKGDQRFPPLEIPSLPVIIPGENPSAAPATPIIFMPANNNPPSPTGVFESNEGDWSRFRVTNVREDNTIYSIAKDKAGNLWVGTMCCLLRYDGSVWTIFTEKDGLAGDDVHAIFVDRESKVWTGGGRGISCYDGQDWHSYKISGFWQDNAITAIGQDNAGNIWFGAMNGCVTRYDGRAWELVYGQGYNDAKAIEYIAQDRAGKIWFFNFDGETMFCNNGTWVTETGIKTDGQLTVDNEGNIWTVINREFRYYDGSVWNNYPSLNIPNSQGFDIYFDRQGYLWVVSMNDIRYYDLTTGKLSIIDSSFLVQTSAFIYQDSDGNFWAGTWTKGLYKYNLE